MIVVNNFFPVQMGSSNNNNYGVAGSAYGAAQANAYTAPVYGSGYGSLLPSSSAIGGYLSTNDLLGGKMMPNIAQLGYPVAASPVAQPAYDFSGHWMMGMMDMMCQMMMYMLLQQQQGGGYGQQPGYPEPQPPVYEQPKPPVYEQPKPPVYEQPKPPVYETPKEKILGSAGLFGDPKFGLFSTGLGAIPEALKAFDSGIKNGQTVTLLNDADKGGFKVEGTGIQVNAQNANSTGIGNVSFQIGADKVQLANNGDLLVNGQVKGNIKSEGLIAPIKLANGATVGTSQEIDGANNVKAERFFINNGEYKVTAGYRSPDQAKNYYDMNFEELVANAADNATGHKVTVAALSLLLGIAELLRMEPGDLKK